jgi:prophage regulatory protein
MPRSVTERVRSSLSTMPSLPPLVAAHEIAQMLGVSRQRVSQLAISEGFPEPAAILTVGRIWLREDIEDWAKATGRTIPAPEQS